MTAPRLVETPRIPATHESAKAAWRRERIAIFKRAFAPVENLSLSEWADRYRFLSRENAESGQWDTARVPYLREIMDAYSDPAIHELVVMKGAQIGFTQGIILNAIGRSIDQNPGPLLVVQPAEGDAEKFSKNKLAPMIRDTERVRTKIIGDGKAKDANNTILSKIFHGGSLSMTGATSPKGLRRENIREIFFDEVDGYPESAGSEGDPIEITKKRLITFHGWKAVYGSTPTTRGASRIEQLFQASDQRYYHVPCPECKKSQQLVWGGRDIKHGIKWENREARTAHYVCLHCQAPIKERWKFWMLARGTWIASAPEHELRGYHLANLYSPFPGAAWSALVAEFLRAQGKPEQLRVFVNTQLAETYEEFGEKLNKSALVDRYESYPAGVRVPKNAGVLTRSVDVQDDRLETAVWAWGAGTECWPVEMEIIPGDPGLPEQNVNSPWRILAKEHLSRAYRHESGVELRPAVTFVDSGGHHTDMAYQFCRPRRAQRLFAIKGASVDGHPVLGKPTEHSAARLVLYHVGSSTGKESLASRLAKIAAPGPGYVHIPDFLDDEHLDQLTAEKLVRKHVGGKEIKRWIKVHPRNEQTDLWVYAYAALWQLGPQFVRDLAAQVDRVNKLGEAGHTTPTPAPTGRRVISRGIE